MSRFEIIAQIEAASVDADLTILKSARFKKQPLRATLFYTQVTLNRYTPLVIPISARTLWGHTLSAYETSAIGSIYFLGFYDSDITLFLLKYFKEEGDLLDVGSNIGYYTSLFTQIASRAATIVAFEPTPGTFAVLHKNVGALKNVTTAQIALSDTTGTSTFYDYGQQHSVFNSATAQSLPFLKNIGKKIDVPTDTLDSWCAQHAIKPCLIKLDTEGTEANILRTSTKILTDLKPLILLEVGGGEAWKKNTTDCLDILTTHDYEFFEVASDGSLLPHTRQTSYEYKNLVCIPQNKISTYVPNR